MLLPIGARQSITLTSQWASWRLKLPAFLLFAQPCVQVQINENINAPRHWPVWEESTGERWRFPSQMASNVENVWIWLNHRAHIYVETVNNLESHYVDGLCNCKIYSPVVSNVMADGLVPLGTTASACAVKASLGSIYTRNRHLECSLT